MSKISILIVWMLLVLPVRSLALDFDLRLDRLSEAFQLLPDADRGTVDDVLDLLKKGQHQEALRRLDELNRMNPDNSSLRVLTAYGLLQVGNLLGAFDEARQAEKAPNGNAYKCWFLSKVALLNGDTLACRRELSHVKSSGDKSLRKEVKQVEEQLKKKG
jgi:Flp pilus assembly protein TadD